ncbi:MAG: cupin domain-containing protein [Acidobacteriota bacterium]|nr:cupin domain-containing protein [Acidobacteriota bacterium]
MKNRRNFLGVVAALLSGLRAKAQAAPRGLVKELARHELTGPEAGREAILVEVTALAGRPSTIHRHPGFVLGYVLDGEMLFAVNGEKPSVVKTGGTFFEPLAVLHTTGASAEPNAPVRFLAFIVAPKGSPVTLPA